MPTPGHGLATPPPRRSAGGTLRPTVAVSVEDLLGSGLILAEEWERLPLGARSEVVRCSDPALHLELLVGQGLLTAYQASRLASGKSFGLILGNYRVLDRL